MAGFTKVFSSILDSTIWCEPWPIKGVWITMLTMADQYGNVHASVPGLAKRATVTIEECEQALAKFLAPDPYSRTPDNEGRRVEAMEGGWHLLNYLRYRDMRDEDARREQNRLAQQKHRLSAKNADSQKEVMIVSTESENVSKKGPMSAQAEAEAEAEKRSTPLPPKGGRRRREAKPESLDTLGQPVPVELVEAVGRIVESCPREDRDGRKIRVTRGDVLTRLMEIQKSHSSVTLEILVQAWADYIASQPAHIKAPQYFFGKAEDQGPNAANWLPYARAVYVRLQLSQEVSA